MEIFSFYSNPLYISTLSLILLYLAFESNLHSLYCSLLMSLIWWQFLRPKFVKAIESVAHWARCCAVDWSIYRTRFRVWSGFGFYWDLEGVRFLTSAGVGFGNDHEKTRLNYSLSVKSWSKVKNYCKNRRKMSCNSIFNKTKGAE